MTLLVSSLPDPLRWALDRSAVCATRSLGLDRESGSNCRSVLLRTAECRLEFLGTRGMGVAEVVRCLSLRMEFRRRGDSDRLCFRSKARFKLDLLVDDDRAEEKECEGSTDRFSRALLRLDFSEKEWLGAMDRLDGRR